MTYGQDLDLKLEKKHWKGRFTDLLKKNWDTLNVTQLLLKGSGFNLLNHVHCFVPCKDE